MSLFDRIAPLLAWTPEAYSPLLVAGRRMGWLRSDTARRLLDFPEVFETRGESVSLRDALATP